LAEALSIRHQISETEADARAMGYLADFCGMIPEGCGGIGLKKNATTTATNQTPGS